MISEELAALVATLPDLPRERVRQLAEESAGIAALARSLAAALARYADGAAPFEGWGLVAQAADTLERAIAAPGSMSATALTAAAYELDSLAAPAAHAPAPPAPAPDVPLTSLRRRT